MLTNQRYHSYVYAVMSLAADSHFLETPLSLIVTYIFSRVMVYSVPTGQVVPTSGQVVASTCECSGVSTTDFYQLTGSVQLKLLNDSCSTK